MKLLLQLDLDFLGGAASAIPLNLFRGGASDVNEGHTVPRVSQPISIHCCILSDERIEIGALMKIFIQDFN
jgi:hypothetical protein